MSTSLPADILTTVRTRIIAALQPAAPVGGLWWLLKYTSGSLRDVQPYAVVQLQDNGGRDYRMIGSVGWRGIVTIRAIADDLSTAETALAALVRQAQTHATYRYPLTFPPLDGRWQVGAVLEWTILED